MPILYHAGCPVSIRRTAKAAVNYLCMFRAGFFIDICGIINLYGVPIRRKHAPGGRFRAAGPGFALCDPDLRENAVFCKQKSLSAMNGQALAFGGFPGGLTCSRGR